jgi:hypothetical protein
LDDILAFVAQSPVAQSLKSSRFVYPLVNAAHILGLATLFGSILCLDLRLLGAFRSVPAQPLARYLPRVAAFGLGVAIVTGALLFTVEPQDYAANPAFLTKAALVGLPHPGGRRDRGRITDLGGPVAGALDGGNRRGAADRVLTGRDLGATCTRARRILLGPSCR